MSKRLLSLAAFQTWLASKHPNTKVGIAGEDNTCPLATFLKQTTGKTPSVTAREFELIDEEDNYTRQDLPRWAQHFVLRVDDRGEGSVSAACALRITNESGIGRDRYAERFQLFG